MTDELLDPAIATTGGAHCGTASRGLNIDIPIGAPIRARKIFNHRSLTATERAHRCAKRLTVDG
jgi:hypothetical protein